MSYGLFDYAAENREPAELPPAETDVRDASKIYRAQQERRESVERIKTSILQQLERGNAPELVLYSAIRAIGIATADEDFTRQASGYLDQVYGDLLQGSFLQDNVAVAAARLEELRSSYLDKLRSSIERQQRQVAKLSIALQEAGEALDALDRET